MYLKYNAQVVTLVGRYIEVKVIDDYDDFWVGMVFGLTVRGKGGEGHVRGGKVTGIEGQTILMEAINSGGVELWKKL
jgi:hypothetical protein